ncbi:MAG: glycoside hydrolase family 31 protein [Pyrinomonadaceae bacterium]
MNKQETRRIRTGIACIAAFLIIFCGNVFASWETVGRVTKVANSKTNGVVLDTSSKAKVLVEFYGANVIRVKVAPNGKFEGEFSYAIDPVAKFDEPKITVSQTVSSITLSKPDGTKVVIQKAMFSVAVFDEKGNAIVQNDASDPTSFNLATGEIKTTMMRRSEVETYYGFGEKAFAEMSRNGKFIVNWNTDTFSYPIGTDPIYQSIPFFTALYDGRAYGLFFNNTFRTWFDMGARSPGKYSFGADGGELDYFIFTGSKDKSPKEILADYATLTGKTPLPPIWALGNQQSRWSYFPESRVREIADGFRSRKIPLDVLYLDIDYMDGYRVFTWDKKRFPDPPKLISDLKKDGIQTVLIIDPGIKVDENSSVYKDGQKNGIFVKNPDGSELNRDVWPQSSAFPDFTNAKAREWFGSQYKNHVAEGVAGFWNDMNEPGVFMNDKTEKPEVLHHPAKTFPYDTPHKGDGLPDTHRRYHNLFGMQMARSTFEGVKKLAPEKRPFVLSRAGFAGIQRFSAVWTGDNYASWDHLAMTIPMLTNMSVSGVPFVGGDVGGFNDRPSGELYARWLQAAALTPFFRSHSVGWAGNKEPWEYGDEFTAINRSTVELRYKFLPYLYTLFKEHADTGSPIMRPLWYEFPADKKTYLVSDEYLVGSDLLVAPVVKEGLRKRQVYLPAGTDWVNWWTGEKLAGGAEYAVDTPLDRLLIFGRAGAMIPTQGVIQNTGEMPSQPVTLTVIAGITPAKVGTATLYQDAGDGYAYQKNGFQIVNFEHRPGSVKIIRSGEFKGQTLKFIEVIGVAAQPKQMAADGRDVKFTYDAATKRVKAEIPDGVSEITMVR